MTDHVKAIVDGVRPMIEVVDAKAKALEARVDDLSAQVRERATGLAPAVALVPEQDPARVPEPGCAGIALQGALPIRHPRSPWCRAVQLARTAEAEELEFSRSARAKRGPGVEPRAAARAA